MNMNQAILEISTGKDLWRMQVMQPDMSRNEHWMKDIYIDSFAVRYFLRDKERHELALNGGYGTVVVFRKISDVMIRINIYVIAESSFEPNSISGRSATLNVPAKKLLAVPDKSHAVCKILCDTSKCLPLCQSRITFDEYAHRNIRMMDKHERRAFSKFIRNAFHHGNAIHIHIIGHRHSGEFTAYEDGDRCGWIAPFHFGFPHKSVRYEMHE